MTDTTVSITADRMPLVRDIGWNRTDSVYTHPDRILDYNVFLFVSKGCMQVVEEGTEYRVREGEHLFLKKGLHHWGLPESKAGTAWYWIHFNDFKDDQLCYSGHIPLPEAGFYTPRHFEYLIELPKHSISTIHPGLDHRLMTLLDDYHKLRLHGMTRTSLAVYELFLDLHETSISLHTETSVYGKGAALTGKVMTYLIDHANEEFLAESLARHMELNYNYVSTTFRKLTGQTIVEVHTKLRINKAIDLMRNTSLNVSEISDRLGYNNPYYFSRVFKKVMGEPPSSYWRHLYKT
ncbi:HTH-type transcriptional activator Btr [compost metagenome]